MTDSDTKLFLLSGFLEQDGAEKEDLERKIRSLGGEVLDDETWNPKCTHVVAKDFAKISEKIMAGLAAGRWIVAKSYVEKSHEKGSWENARPYVSHQIILHHKKNWIKLGRAGGCFHGMKAILLLEDELKCEVYARIIRAGDGVVLEKMTIEMMAERKVDPSSVTHIFLDPTVIHPGHKKHDHFKRWEKFCDESARKTPWHLHYKFLLYKTRRQIVGLSEKNYDIYDVKIQAMARAEFWQRNKQAGKRMTAAQTNGVKSKKQKTGGTAQEVISLDDSDDDIQVLEERMEKEAEERRLEGGSRRYIRKDTTRGKNFKQVKSAKDNEVVELNSDSDDDVVTLDSDEEEEKRKPGLKPRIRSPEREDGEIEMEVDQDEREDSEDEDRGVEIVEEVSKLTREAAPAIFDISSDEDEGSSGDSGIVEEVDEVSGSDKVAGLTDTPIQVGSRDITDSTQETHKDNLLNGATPSNSTERKQTDSDVALNNLDPSVIDPTHSVPPIVPPSYSIPPNVPSTNPMSPIVPPTYSVPPTHSVPSIPSAGISRGLLQAITSLQPPVKKPLQSSEREKVSPFADKSGSSSPSLQPSDSASSRQSSDKDKLSPSNNKTALKPTETSTALPSITTEAQAPDNQNRISVSTSVINNEVSKPIDASIKPSDEPLKEEGRMVAAPVTSKSTPSATSSTSSSSKKSGRNMFREKLKNLIQQNGEKKSSTDTSRTTKAKDAAAIETFVPSIVRAPPSPPPVKEVVPIPVERPHQPLPNVTIEKSTEGHASSSVLHRAVATLLDRQVRTDECIAIGNTNCRTARFDKAGEINKLDRLKINPMKPIVVEEFSSTVDATKNLASRMQLDANDDLGAGLDLDGRAPDEFVLLPRLRELRILTNYTTFPTSSILNTVIKLYMLDQKSPLIVSEAYGYLDHFLFLHLGKESRGQWLKLILASLRNCDESMIDVFSLDNNQDLHGCWLFFKNVLSRVEKEANNRLLNEDTEEEEQQEDVTGPGLLLDFLVKVLQRDFEIWWKHFRRTDHKDTRELSYPMLHYVLGGSKNLFNHANKSILGLYKTLLMSGGDLSNSRKLIAMVALLFSHNDSRDESGWLRGGEKLRLAVAVKKVLSNAQLTGNNLYLELSLLQPNWLSALVAQEAVRKEEKPVISLKEITEKFGKLKVCNDSILMASMDNLVHRMCGFLHCHTIFRIIWHHSKKDQGDLDTFRYMNKLLSRGHKSTEKIIKFKSDVQVSISDLVADMNTLREFVNEGLKEQVPGALSALLFRMTTVTQF